LLLLGGGLLLVGGVPDVDGGVDDVFGFVGGVDCVGQFALASITDPSGHVFVVGGVAMLLRLWAFNISILSKIILQMLPDAGLGFWKWTLDKIIKACFVTAREIYYGAYVDIFSSLPTNLLIRKPIENKQLLKCIDEIMTDGDGS
jgi:hypothetical protein